ncbi:hypothetical protein HZR84_06705 [Hyphobacterium sp. CCMP332]|nr:hypothetical protein HZR84_06705 [Hyphobacterium sp. CCMP332]
MRNFPIKLFALIALLFIACSDDNSGPSGPVSLVPTLNIILTDSTVSYSDTVKLGSHFNIAFSGRKGDFELISWSLSLNESLLPDFIDVPVSDPSNFTEVISDIETPPTVGNYLYTISLKDKNNIVVENSVLIVVEEDNSIPIGPVVSLIATDSTISSDFTLNTGTTFGILVSASKGNRDMQTWSILRNGISLSAFDELDVPDEYNFTIPITNIKVPNNAGVYQFTFQVKSFDGVMGSVSWLITAEAPNSFIEFNNIQLGAQSSTSFGSFLKIDDGTVYFLSEANSSNGADVDLFYYNGATNGPTLFSPTDPDAGSFFGGAVGAWSTQNDTKIEKSSSLDFDNATPNDVATASVSGTKANQLAADDVFVFETEAGIKRMGKVISFATGNDGSITFDLKVVY